MGSKTFVLLGLLLATVLLITSEVTARDLVETSTFKATTEQTNNGVEDAKYGRGGGYHRGGGEYHHGGGEYHHGGGGYHHGGGGGYHHGGGGGGGGR